MKRNVLCALFLVLALSLTVALTSAQTPPGFNLGFKALADQVPDVVGAPLENEHFNLSNGNSEQRTSKGLMVWRKADNWTAFTNGARTWINGPFGVMERANDERFDWEKEAPAPAAAAPTVAPAPTAAPAPAPAPPAPSPAGAATGGCLACHGPFDKLVASTAGYVWPNGDKTSPHRYVPHNSQVVPECTSCHKAHALPATASSIAAMGKADPKSCFSCHHAGVLECGTCHAES